jgi:hypothetical protein
MSSIVLHIQVQPGIEGGDTSAAAIAEQLQRQASDASSPLFAGTITRHTVTLTGAAAPSEVSARCIHAPRHAAACPHATPRRTAGTRRRLEGPPDLARASVLGMQTSPPARPSLPLPHLAAAAPQHPAHLDAPERASRVTLGAAGGGVPPRLSQAASPPGSALPPAARASTPEAARTSDGGIEVVREVVREVEVIKEVPVEVSLPALVLSFSLLRSLLDPAVAAHVAIPPAVAAVAIPACRYACIHALCLNPCAHAHARGHR